MCDVYDVERVNACIKCENCSSLKGIRDSATLKSRCLEAGVKGTLMSDANVTNTRSSVTPSYL